MSTKENDVFLEGIKERFYTARNEKNWSEVSDIYMELEDKGFGYLVPPLSHELSDEECREYIKWDKQINGDTEAQMDDDTGEHEVSLE